MSGTGRTQEVLQTSPFRSARVRLHDRHQILSTGRKLCQLHSKIKGWSDLNVILAIGTEVLFPDWIVRLLVKTRHGVEPSGATDERFHLGVINKESKNLDCGDCVGPLAKTNTRLELFLVRP